MNHEIFTKHSENVATFACENIRKYLKMHNYSLLRVILSLCTNVDDRHRIGRWSVHLVKKPNKAFHVLLKEEVKTATDVCLFLRTDSPASRFITCFAESHKSDFADFLKLLHARTDGLKNLSNDIGTQYAIVDELLKVKMPYWLCCLCRYGYSVVKEIMSTQQDPATTGVFNIRHLVVRCIVILRVLNPLIIDEANDAQTKTHLVLAKSLMLLGHDTSNIDSTGTKMFDQFCTRVLTRSVSFNSPRIDLTISNKLIFTISEDNETMAKSYFKEFVEVRNFIWENKVQIVNQLDESITNHHCPAQMLTSVFGICNNAILSFHFFDCLMFNMAKLKSRKGSKNDDKYLLSVIGDFEKWCCIFTNHQLGFLEHIYIARSQQLHETESTEFRGPILPECVLLLDKLGRTGANVTDLRAHMFYNWFQTRHTIFQAMYSMYSIENLKITLDIPGHCIFENGELPLTFSTPVLKKIDLCKSNGESSSESSDSSNSKKKKFRTGSLQRLFTSKPSGNKKDDYHDKHKNRRSSAPQAKEWGMDVIQNSSVTRTPSQNHRPDSPRRSPKCETMKMKNSA